MRRFVAPWLLLLRGARAHVPTYGGGADNCFAPAHAHTTSQAVYLRGSGGLEIHCSADDCPFDVAGGEVIDVDAVFQHEYDTSTYALHVGCGGCVWPLDPIAEPPRALRGYQPGVVEPFTQTFYRSVFADEERVYNTSLLAQCAEDHFTIRVVDYHNRSEPGHETLLWSAVVGKAERFTLLELVSFPLYVLRNHGSAWNGLGWTWWLILASVVPAFWLVRFLARRWFGLDWLSVFHPKMTLEPRAWLCEFALLSFLAVAIEEAVHLVHAQAHVPLDYHFWVGMSVLVGANGVPLLLQFVIYRGLYHRDDWITASTRWWPLELASGISWLFLFGAGFYIGPALVVLDALVRAYEDLAGWRAPRLDVLLERQGLLAQERVALRHTRVRSWKSLVISVG